MLGLISSVKATLFPKRAVRPRVGTIQAQTQQDQKSKLKNEYYRITNPVISACLLIFFIVALQFTGELHWFEYFGFLKDSPLPDVTDSTVIHYHPSCNFENIPKDGTRLNAGDRSLDNMTMLKYDHISKANVAGRNVKCFDRDGEIEELYLPKVWHIVPDKPCLNASFLNSNVCLLSGNIEIAKSGDTKGAKQIMLQNKTVALSTKGTRVSCLPSLIIIGFEKCSTTEMMLWLSYHPNVLSLWKEIRFHPGDGGGNWRDYLHLLPTMPRGLKGVGKYYTLDKSPGYVDSRTIAQFSSRIVPSASIVVMIRNPTSRAYSSFAMYTRMTCTVEQILKFKSTEFSLIVKNEKTNDVRFEVKGGRAGTCMPVEALSEQPFTDTCNTPNTSNAFKPDTQHTKSGCPSGWRYLTFPPSPDDFHHFVEWTLSPAARPCNRWDARYADWNEPIGFPRNQKIIWSGMYSMLLKRWFQYFSSDRFMIIPEESFWSGDVVESFTRLQSMLGLPYYNYKKATTYRKDTKRYRLRSISTDILDYTFNSGASMKPMRGDTRRMLDDLYCESNKELMSLMKHGHTLHGYSCI